MREALNQENKETAIEIIGTIDKMGKEMGLVSDIEDVKTIATGFLGMMLYKIIVSVYTEIERLYSPKIAIDYVLDTVFDITKNLNVRERFTEFWNKNYDASKLQERALKFNDIVYDKENKEKVANIYLVLSNIISLNTQNLLDVVACWLYIIDLLELQKDLVSITMLAFNVFEKNYKIKIYDEIMQRLKFGKT